MQLLKGLRLLRERLLQPLDRARLVVDEQGQLQERLRGQPLAVVLGDLLRQEEHAVALGEARGESGVELGCGERHHDAALHVEGDHAIEQQEVLPLGDHLGLVILGDEHRKLAQVGAGEVPDAPFGAGFEFEARFEAVVGLVRGDHQILLDGGARDLPVGALPLVEGAHVGHDEAGSEHGLLNGVPDGVAGVVEDDRHPAARLEDAAVFGEAALHQALIVGDRLALGTVDDGFRGTGGADAVPALDEIVEVGVVYCGAGRDRTAM